MTIATSMNIAQKLEQGSNPEDAIAVYRKILSRFPRNTRARAALDELQQRMATTAVPAQDTMAELRALFDGGAYQKAAEACTTQLNIYRRSHELWFLLGQCHLMVSKLDEAATCLNKACELNPQSAATFAAMAEVSGKLGRMDDAVALYRKALSLDENHLPALNGLSGLLHGMDRADEASALRAHATSLAPENPAVLLNHAKSLRDLGDLAAARDLLEQVIALAPSMAEALIELGEVAARMQDHPAAIDALDRVLEAQPENDRARAQKLFLMAQINDWRWVAEYQANRRTLGLRGTGCAPEHLITFEDNPDLLRVKAQAHAGEGAMASPTPPPAPGTPRPARLRVGYFAPDLHPLADLFARHDRSRFDISLYTYGPSAAEGADTKLVPSCERLRDVSKASDSEIAAFAHADGLDIAIHLQSAGSHSRPSLFNQRLAPLHIAYPGHPGTLGSPSYDYLIADEATCPHGSERYFEECLLRLPETAFVARVPGAATAPQLTRADCNLPNEGYVFCCFNAAETITPTEFDSWMRLLSQIEGSVLWLKESDHSAKENLRRECAARGIDSGRLIFASPQNDHEEQACFRVADLYLDTFTLNGQRRTAAALAAGLPVVTLPGRQMAARIGASLLTASGLPEMIATDIKDYEAKALKLAQDLDASVALRRRLAGQHDMAPLFNATSFARNLEAGLDQAFDRYLQGLPATHVDIAEPQKHTAAIRRAVSAA